MKITKCLSRCFNPQLSFSLFCLFHLFMWTLTATWLRSTVSFDTIEGYAWGNQWQWGYDKHPFLAPWLTALFANLGGSMGWPIYLLGQLLVVTAFWAMWRLANKMLTPMAALVSVLVLEGIAFYSFGSMNVDPDPVSLATWALASLCFYNALRENKTRDWILTGLCCGLAMDAKYTALLLGLTMVVTALFVPRDRNVFLSYKPYVAILVFFLAFFPNLTWLIQHNFISIQYAIGRSEHHQLYNAWLNHIAHPFGFIVDGATRLIVPFLLLLPLMAIKTARHETAIFDRRFVLSMFFTPFVSVALISCITGASMHAGWAYPFFNLSGIFLVQSIKLAFTPNRIKVFATVFIVFATLQLTGKFIYMDEAPYFAGRERGLHFPAKEIADNLAQAWEKQYHQPLYYVAGPRYLASVITAYAPDHPIPYFAWSEKHSAWVNKSDLRKKGALFVWWADRTPLPPEVLKRFPDITILPVRSYAYMTHAHIQPVAIGIAFLPPQTSVSG